MPVVDSELEELEVPDSESELELTASDRSDRSQSFQFKPPTVMVPPGPFLNFKFKFNINFSIIYYCTIVTMTVSWIIQDTVL